MDGFLTLYWHVQGADRWFYSDAWVYTDDGQVAWLGSTGSTPRLNDAYVDGLRLLRARCAAPEFEDASGYPAA